MYNGQRGRDADCLSSRLLANAIRATVKLSASHRMVKLANVFTVFLVVSFLVSRYAKHFVNFSSHLFI